MQNLYAHKFLTVWLVVSNLYILQQSVINTFPSSNAKSNKTKRWIGIVRVRPANSKAKDISHGELAVKYENHLVTQVCGFAAEAILAAVKPAARDTLNIIVAGARTLISGYRGNLHNSVRANIQLAWCPVSLSVTHLWIEASLSTDFISKFYDSTLADLIFLRLIPLNISRLVGSARFPCRCEQTCKIAQKIMTFDRIALSWKPVVRIDDPGFE